jgi:hypothetical protein
MPTAASLAVLALAARAAAQDPPYSETVNRVAGMISDATAQALAARHGLQVLNVLWEDTGRWQGSAMGPNISDVTIEVVSEGESARPLALMPVLRFPNFSDRTADVRLDRIHLRVGNEREDSVGGHPAAGALSQCQLHRVSSGDHRLVLKRDHLVSRCILGLTELQSSCGPRFGTWDPGHPERRAAGPESRGPRLRFAPLGLNGSQADRRQALQSDSGSLPHYRLELHELWSP